MLFRRKTLDGIRDGVITLAFRRWKKPSVKSGGTQRTAIGKLRIGDVAKVAAAKISAVDARKAGYATKADLMRDLDDRDGDVYRVEIRGVEADERIALRESVPGEPGEFDDIMKRLARLDTRSSIGPWTQRVLQVVSGNPAVRAGDLCELVGQERAPFKLNVRKLKNLGLTESLGTGYRISPRGEAVLARLRDDTSK